MVSLGNTNDHIFFVAKDGSLWCEGYVIHNRFLESKKEISYSIKKLSFFKDHFSNVFCDDNNVYLLCNNGKIWHKGESSNTQEKRGFFYEICSVSNVIGITTFSNRIYFLLDNGDVLVPSSYSKGTKLVRVASNINCIKGDKMLTNDGQILMHINSSLINILEDDMNFNIIDFHQFNKFILISGSHTGVIILERNRGTFVDFKLPDYLQFRRNPMKSANK